MAKLILVDYHDYGKAADILLANFLWEDEAQKRAEKFNRNPEHRDGLLRLLAMIIKYVGGMKLLT